MWFKKKKKERDQSPTKNKYQEELNKEETVTTNKMGDMMNHSILLRHYKNSESHDASEENNFSSNDNDEYNYDDDEEEEEEEEEEEDKDEDEDEDEEDSDEDASHSSSESSDSSDSDHEGMDDNDFMHRLITNDPSLTEIDISIESNDYETCTEFANALSMNFHVKILHLTGNNNAARMKIFKTITSAISKNKSIRTLEMKRATIDHRMAIELGICLKSCTSLQTLKLTNCDFKDSALTVLFLGIQHCATLQEIIIRSCDLGGDAIDFVAATLSLMEIKSLSLINTNISSDGLKILCESVAKTSQLEELHLSRNSFDIKDARSLSSCLISPKQNIKCITLGACSLDDECIKILSKSFIQNKKIQKILLPRNDITGKGAMILKRVIETNSSIIELDVDGCKISSRKQLAIADALRCNNSFLKSFCSNEVSITILDAVDLCCGGFSGNNEK